MISQALALRSSAVSIGQYEPRDYHSSTIFDVLPFHVIPPLETLDLKHYVLDGNGPTISRIGSTSPHCGHFTYEESPLGCLEAFFRA